MNLSGLFQYGNKNSQSRSVSQVRPQTAVSSGTPKTQPVKNLVPGQTIQGEIVAKNGSEVQIRLNGDTVINARLEKDLQLSPGQNMTFEVKNNTGAQVALRPLYENLAQDPNVLRALEAAKLPSQEALLRMVSSMMERGMSIDKNSVLDMSRLLAANPGAAPETVVGLKSMQFPVTPENISQFEAYGNYEHQLLNGVKDILSGLSSTFQSMMANGQQTEAADLYLQVLQLFTGIGPEETESTGQRMVFADIIENGRTAQGGASGLLEGPMAENGTTPAGGTETAGTESGSTSNTLSAAADVPMGLAETAEAPENTGKSGNGTQGINEETAGADGAKQTAQAQDTASGAKSAAQLVGSGGVDNLNRLLVGIGFSEEMLSGIKDGTKSGEQLLKEIAQMLSGTGEHKIDSAAVKDLFGSREYGQLLDGEILRQWLMKPQDVARKGNVEEFYEKLRQQTARLTEALGQIAKDTPLSKSLTSVQNNIDFMNQLNQLYQYVQLPLKMSGGEAHGDLYVYTNKKNRTNADGSVSALLHLDMEYLGTVDVYVTMRDNQVATRFYLQDESVIDFIEAHISMLDERLAGKGYSLKAEMLLKEESGGEEHPDNVLRTLAGEDHQDRLLSCYSFDVRA